MKIKEITSQSRRDFHADYECEHCGHVIKDGYGYDDDNFHKTVIPKMKCPECNKIAPESYRALSTKYDANQVV